MTTTAPCGNEEAIRDLYSAVAAGDIERAARGVTPDVIVHVPGRGGNAGEHWGREGFTRFLRNIIGYQAGTFSLYLRSLASHGDTVFTREVATMNRRRDPDRTWHLSLVMHYRMRGDLVAEAWTIPEDQHRYDDYWGADRIGTGRGTAAAEAPDRRVAPGSARENLQLVEDLYRHFWDGEFESIRDLYAPDFVFFAPGCGYLSGTYEGWDGYLEFRRRLMAIVGGKYHLDVDAIASNDTEVFAREFIRMNTLSDPRVHASYVVMHFQIDNGLIVRANDFPVDLYQWESFFTVRK